MINNKNLLRIMQKNSIEFFTGVPDSLLKDFLGYVNDNISYPNHIIAANEGNAIGLAIGNYLATKKLSLVYLQNSGLGNTINPLLSLADNCVYGIPMILMIGWRGKPGVKDEPQHFVQGLLTKEILEIMKIPYLIINKDSSEQDLQKIIEKASKDALLNNHPFALLVEKGSFQSYTFLNKISDKKLMTREEALEICIESINNEDIVVSTTGMLSRELFEIREKKNMGHSNDFLTIGGMGHANQIALGIALKKPNKNIYCFDGDGALLMHMGSMALNGSLKLKNYKHILFNNNVHDSVGGQPTPSKEISFKDIAKITGYEFQEKASDKSKLIKVLNEININKKSSFLEILIKKGARKNLSRPQSTPKKNKEDLMNNTYE